jgi:ketosteroid isomerase-like protein
MNLKHRSCGTLALVFAAILLAKGALAATDTNRAAFTDIYTKVSKALKEKDMKEKDMNTIISYETEDYTSKSLSGETENRDQTNEKLKQGFSVFKKISSFDEEIVEAKFENDTATIVVSETMKATIADPEGKDHTVNGLTKSRDIWVKKDGKWKIKSSEMIEDKSTLDGIAVR